MSKSKHIYESLKSAIGSMNINLQDAAIFQAGLLPNFVNENHPFRLESTSMNLVWMSHRQTWLSPMAISVRLIRS